MTPSTVRRNVRSPQGFTLIEFLVVALLVLILMSLVSPALHNAQRDARSLTCKNNLKMLGLAMHNYHDVFGTFPPGWVAPHWEAGNGSGFGWQAFLLPYIEEYRLYETLDFEKVSFTNASVRQKIKWLRCPADPTPDLNPVRGKLATSNYSGNFGDQPAPRLGFGRRTQFWAGNAATPQQASGLLWANSSVRLRDITDGTSYTIMAGERSSKSGAAIWAGTGDNAFESDAVTDTSTFNFPNKTANSFSSHHRGGVFLLMGDGAVRFFADKIIDKPNEDLVDFGPTLWEKLGNRSDGHPIEDF